MIYGFFSRASVQQKVPCLLRPFSIAFLRDIPRRAFRLIKVTVHGEFGKYRVPIPTLMPREVRAAIIDGARA